MGSDDQQKWRNTLYCQYSTGILVFNDGMTTLLVTTVGVADDSSIRASTLYIAATQPEINRSSSAVHPRTRPSHSAPVSIPIPLPIVVIFTLNDAVQLIHPSADSSSETSCCMPAIHAISPPPSLITHTQVAESQHSQTTTTPTAPCPIHLLSRGLTCPSVILRGTPFSVASSSPRDAANTCVLMALSFPCTDRPHLSSTGTSVSYMRL